MRCGAHLRLPCILPLLDYVHTTIKLAKGRDILVCGFVESLKLAQHKLKLYCDPLASLKIHD